MDNGFIEAPDSTIRTECLNAHWFMSLADVQENWRLGICTTTKTAPTALSDITS